MSNECSLLFSDQEGVLSRVDKALDNVQSTMNARGRPGA